MIYIFICSLTMQFNSCLHRLHILGHRMSLWIKIASSELSREIYLGNFAFQIRKIIKRHPHYCHIVSPSDFHLRKKNVIFKRGICVFNIPIHKLKVFENTSNLELKLGFIAFSLSIFRITLRTSSISVFRLSISSLNFD